jgi:hypothetical protein
LTDWDGLEAYYAFFIPDSYTKAYDDHNPRTWPTSIPDFQPFELPALEDGAGWAKFPPKPSPSLRGARATAKRSGVSSPNRQGGPEGRGKRGGERKESNEREQRHKAEKRGNAKERSSAKERNEEEERDAEEEEINVESKEGAEKGHEIEESNEVDELDDSSASTVTGVAKQGERGTSKESDSSQPSGDGKLHL